MDCFQTLDNIAQIETKKDSFSCSLVRTAIVWGMACEYIR